MSGHVCKVIEALELYEEIANRLSYPELKLNSKCYSTSENSVICIKGMF